MEENTLVFLIIAILAIIGGITKKILSKALLYLTNNAVQSPQTPCDAVSTEPDSEASRECSEASSR